MTGDPELHPADAIAPDGSEIRFLVPPSPGAGSRILLPEPAARTASLVEVRLPGGTQSRPVCHRTVEEIWFVLSGRGSVLRTPPEGAPRRDPLLPGVVVVIPTGWTFSFAAEEGTELRFLCYTSPPWPGDQEAELADY